MKKIMVLGGGTIGTGIAQVVAIAGCNVVIWDDKTGINQLADLAG